MRYDRMHCEENADDARKAIRALYSEEEVDKDSINFSQLSDFLAINQPKSCILPNTERPS